MSYAIHKQTYSGGQAYRYHVTDEAGNLCYVAEPTGLLLPTPTRLIEFFDPDHQPVCRIQPPDSASWHGVKHYRICVGEATEEPYAVIRECFRLVDLLLLRLPRYEVQLGQYGYVVRGSRYGESFYGIFRAREGESGGEDQDQASGGGVDEEPAGGETTPSEATAADEETARPTEIRVGQIRRPKAGPSYVVETDAAPLRQALIVLAALVILIDIELNA